MKLGWLLPAARSELDGRASVLARASAGHSHGVTRAAMDYLNPAWVFSQADAGSLSRVLRTEVFRWADYAQGVTAFKEKRRALWPSLAGATQA